ncbi:MAG: Branched-chain amino acid transport system / permease component [Tenericutes bacterium ADurb.Bin239]|nr:MAG: Branched-chain amino acid transport system / permease component [Tenericutes bacterium ADurb.Bin239]
MTVNKSKFKAFLSRLPKLSKKQIIKLVVIIVIYVLLVIFTTDNMYALLTLTIYSAIPLAIVAMGGMYSERSGVVNIALEGTMMMGAFVGILCLSHIQHAGVDGQHIIFLALLIGAVAGIIFSLLHAFAAITMKSDQTITGTALNMLAASLAIFVGRALSLGRTEEITFSSTHHRISQIPVLKYIPFFGKILFENIYLISLFGILLFIVMGVIAYKTKFGLRLRACGENPHAADAAGINVIKIRYAGVLISGMLGGIGGVLLIIPTTVSFIANVYGFGFLALAVLISGQWKPSRIMLFALFFGLLRSIASGFELIKDDLSHIAFLKTFLDKLPTDILNMLPYVVTLIFLAFTSLKSRGPKASGQPFDQGKR